MFHGYRKNDILFYAALIFLVYPLGGVFWFNYPLWTVPFTFVFALSYIALIHIKDVYRKTIAALWFCTMAYIALMTCFLVEPSMMWYFFFQSNLLIWRFRDSIKSYRSMTFLFEIFGVSLYCFLQVSNSIGRIVIIVIPAFILILHYSQNRIRFESDLQTEVYRQNQYINLLTAENERSRIGRDLHDTLGHTFAMMTLKTELALRQLEQTKLEAVRKELTELHQISKDSMKEVRSLVDNLKYRTVEEELSVITEMFSFSDIDLTIDQRLNLQTLTPIIQSSITMILRELTTNVIKHAERARHCQIKLRKHQDAIVVEVSDDGCGFDRLTGQELRSIRERLQFVKGEAKIVSSQNPTVIRVSFEESNTKL
ncbi:sensor histidine kinase [Streptococcus chenjunshii]|uniref:histidine kinase n=1 Tax=Streptococcus chenjunshii TaxID=2173853 RepID=A0A372KMD5_9STRE|nr:sensor histidine kinase [Streptococcus chenjunshii]AXQ78187.1 sensor histidine kinase [Streptococcus chenjunshii]RFU50942.1 sensor histidine kinase [Streptococcus chenjunshii]RFU53439.1 sensor histidine kinase [Streptococcus chenjunshii]